MKFDPRFWQTPLYSFSQIIISALLDWATLQVDPEGAVVPDHVARRIKIIHPIGSNSVITQNAEQKSQWEHLVGRFYDRMIDFSKKPEIAFSTSAMAITNEYLREMPDLEETTQEKRYPRHGIGRLSDPNPSPGTLQAQRLTEIMLHQDEENALRFLESVVLKWAGELPPGQVEQLRAELPPRGDGDPTKTWSEADLRGYALFRIAESLEH
jgi:hypothetical protein